MTSRPSYLLSYQKCNASIFDITLKALSDNLVLNCYNYMNPSTILGSKEGFKVQYIKVYQKLIKKKFLCINNNVKYLKITKQTDSVDFKLDKP